MHNFIEAQLNNLKEITPESNNYSEQDYIDLLKSKAKMQMQSWLDNVDNIYDREVDYSDYQQEKYIAEFFGYKISYKKGIEKLND